MTINEWSCSKGEDRVNIASTTLLSTSKMNCRSQVNWSQLKKMLESPLGHAYIRSINDGSLRGRHSGGICATIIQPAPPTPIFQSSKAFKSTISFYLLNRELVIEVRCLLLVICFWYLLFPTYYLVLLSTFLSFMILLTWIIVLTKMIIGNMSTCLHDGAAFTTDAPLRRFTLRYNYFSLGPPLTG